VCVCVCEDRGGRLHTHARVLANGAKRPIRLGRQIMLMLQRILAFFFLSPRFVSSFISSSSSSCPPFNLPGRSFRYVPGARRHFHRETLLHCNNVSICDLGDRRPVYYYYMLDVQEPSRDRRRLRRRRYISPRSTC
jgi:hypothetical protein